MIKVLAIGDTADNIASLKKFTKRSKIHLINFPRKQAALFTYSSEGVEFFDSLLISRQVKKINQIKDNYDLCLVMSWAAARVAYLSGLNYIMYFVGGDIVTPPFVKKPRVSYLKEPVYNRNFIERKFYRKVFDTAIACIAPTDEYYSCLKKYREDGIRMDRILVDTTLFNDKIEPIDLPKKKFTFFSPQRIGIEKGHDIIWKALKLCKSDFEVWQVKWFIERTPEEEKTNQLLMEQLPTQVKFIPLIKREDIGRYFVWADAILGQMRAGIQGGIERDAAFCKKAVICYTDPTKATILDNKKIVPPFLPQSNDPQELADLIDKIVSSKEFRDDLAKREFEYIQELSSPDKVVDEWENIFEELIKKHKSINRKTSFRLRIENVIASFAEKFIYVRIMRDKNIQSWGKEEYKKLMKKH